jgi:hypothetical protein
MATSSQYGSETPEQREIRRRKNTVRRVRVMVAIFAVAVLARVFIKNPPPPKTPDYSHYKVRYVPGMLEAIPAAQRSQMDPKLLAMMVRADEEARHGLAAQQTAGSFVKKTYEAAEAPLASESRVEAEKQFVYAYTKRRQEKIHEMEQEERRETTKTTVVQFTGGGYLHVEQASESGRVYEIKFDRTMLATVPSHMVQRVRPNAVDWSPPLGRNEVELKPARGITIVLQRQLAARIPLPTLPLQ